MNKRLTVRDLSDELTNTQVTYAIRLAQEPRVLTRTEKRAMFAECAGLQEWQVSPGFLRELEKRPDFLELVSRLRYSNEELAKQLINGMLPQAVGLRVKALSEMERRIAESPDTADLRLVPALTDPLLERAWPKKQEQAVTAVAVTISLSPRQAELLEQPQYTVDAELLPSAPSDPAHGDSDREDYTVG